MDATRFDAIAKLFAGRRSRRRALAGVGAALAGALAAGHVQPASAQEGTPTASPAAAEKEGPAFLFLQAFRSGRVEPKDGGDGRYTLTLEQGLGHTIYFSDRPDRIVGATPTARFLGGLGFPDDNPPNAALVVEGPAGVTEIAVVELFDPSYDEASHTATYEVATLAAWERSGEAGFTEAAADLAAFGPTFGAPTSSSTTAPIGRPTASPRTPTASPGGSSATRGTAGT